jgi:hypothetical protein
MATDKTIVKEEPVLGAAKQLGIQKNNLSSMKRH